MIVVMMMTTSTSSSVAAQDLAGGVDGHVWCGVTEGHASAAERQQVD